MNQLVALDGPPPVAAALCVLKFGSSVLECEADVPRVVQEIYRHVRDGEKVVAVVSALAGETDALLAQAERLGGDNAPGALVARLARVGELRSAALLALALSRVGLNAVTLDPHELGLRAEGDPLDSDLAEIDRALVRKRLEESDVLVVPGFIADHAEHGVVTLGRGGTDLSAVFVAARLGAERVRLIKDVDGVYDADPAAAPDAHRYAQLGYEEAERVSAGLVQGKALRHAAAAGLRVEVACLGSREATVISDLPASRLPLAPAEPVRVALLGCGAVGGGVLPLLLAEPDGFAVGPVLVRRPRPPSSQPFTHSLDEALAGDPDILIELVGGVDLAAEAMHRALAGGAQVVTGNKAALARHWDSLHAAAARHGGALRYSAAVGGGTPIVETLRRLEGEVVALEGVMNGTCNYLLDRLAAGCDFAAAVAEAQALGFAEADPSADVDGHDAADKLSILIREAFGVALLPHSIARQSLRDLAPGAAAAARAAGQVLKQVGRCRRHPDGRVEAAVELVILPADHSLAGARNEDNRFLVHRIDGKVDQVFGKGAGRWPTATAIFADVLDARGAVLAARAQAPPPTLMQLKA